MGDLQYEGEYLYGEKNLTAKEYHNGTLCFDGEYFYVKKYKGKIKTYSEYDKLMFEGEILNDEKNGEGKEYNDYYSYFIFKGEYENGKKEKGKNIIVDY